MNRSPKPKDAKEIFSAAIEYYLPHQWEGYIHDACGDDEALRGRVRELLDAHRQTDSFFDRENKQQATAPITERPGSQIGPYKLLQEIGEGGFGVVYMAEQLEPVRRKVALKIIKPGMDTKQVVARFEAERQALALMDHPNIARVLDAGSTDSGRPYFVMELVKGVPITEYCDKNNLNTNDRLALFVPVCRAVQHAHQKGVIHRDLKPSNVMVTLHDGHPVPKVIDFGVSKAISQQLTEKTLFTAYGQMIGTPQYMSPEQAEMSGLDVDTRSDVYSLGVLLYELLTGTTPIGSERLKTLAYGEMQRVIREEEPPRPSARISTMGGELTVLAKHRSTDPKHLTQSLRGDLDWIVMKALAKERTRRYESPGSFAADVERHLADEPTEARPPSTAYQIQRFVRRYKGPVAAAAAVMLVLLLGIAGTTSGLITATQAKRQAQQEALKARSAEEAARQSEEAARAAEAEARANLQRSEELSGQLSASVAKLSENASRLAAQRAQTLIEQDRRAEGLHWLSRALELAPAADSPLATEIRTTMSVIAATLPSPRFVIPCAEDEDFAQTVLSPDGSRIVQLIRTDPPAEPRALEARLLDAVTGQVVTSMAVPPATSWVGFSADGGSVFSFDGQRLQRWSDKTGSAIGPGVDLSRYRNDGAATNVSEGFAALIQDRLASAPPEVQQRMREILLERTGIQIRGITAGGKAILFSKARRRPPATEGGRQGRDAGPASASRTVTSLYLLDLETDTETPIPGPPTAQLARGGEMVVIPGFFADPSTPRTQRNQTLRAWDVAAANYRDDWHVELDFRDGPTFRPGQFEVDQEGRWVLGCRSDPPIQADPGSTVYYVDVTNPQRRGNTLEVKGFVNDLALSPSGSWAAILTSTADGRSRVTVWEFDSGRSRVVPLRMDRVAATANPFTRGAGNVRIGIAADDSTLLLWGPLKLVGWRLASATHSRLALPTAGRVEQLRAVGRELITVSGGASSGALTRVRGLNAVTSGTPLEIQRWDSGNGQPIRGPIPVVANLVAVSPDGRTLATAQGSTIQCWSLETMSNIGSPIHCQSAVTRIDFVADGKQVAAQMSARRGRGADRGPVRITYQQIGAGMKPAPSGDGLLVDRLVPGSAAQESDLRVNDIVLRVGDRNVATVEEFRQQVDLDSGDGLKLTVQRDGVEKMITLRPDPWPEDQLRQRLDGAEIAEVRVWDVHSGQPIGPLPIPREGERGARGGFGGGGSLGPIGPAGGNRPWAAVSPDGGRVVTAGVFGRRTELRLFSVASGRPIRASVEHPDQVRWLGFGPLGRLLATLDTTSTVQLWDAETLTPAGPRIEPAATVSGVTFAPDGKSLILCERAVDGPRLSLWDTATSQRLSPSIPAPTQAGLLECSPDGAWLAGIAGDHSAWLMQLPKPWTGDARRMRQLVEATTGTTMNESGDIVPLDGPRWKSQLDQVPAAIAERRRFTGSTDSPWDLDPVRRSGFAGFRGFRRSPTSEQALKQNLEELDESLADHPQSGLLRLRRTDVLLRLGRFDDANVEFEGLLSLVDRQNLSAWLKRRSAPAAGFAPRFASRPGPPQGSPGGGNTAVGRGPGTGGLRVALSAETRKWCLENALRLNPSDAGALLQLINLQAESGKTNQAKALFARAMKHDARNLILQSLQAVTESAVSRTAFLSVLRNISTDDQERSAARAAQIEVLETRSQAAKHLVDWIIDQQPEAWEPLMIRAEAALHEGRFDDAAEDLMRVRALASQQQYEPRLREMASRAGSGTVSGSREDQNSIESISRPLPVWETVIEVFPEDVNALTQLKHLHGRLADWEQAAHWLQRLAAATPEESWPRYQLAPVLLKLGRVDQYRELCQAMLEQFDESSEPLYEGRAIQACLWHRQAVENPRRLVERMEAIIDRSPVALYWRQTTLGIAHLRSGSQADAIDWLEKPLDPDSGVIPTCEVRALAALAIASCESGDEAKAREVYQRATERYAAEAPEAGVEDLGSSWHDWLICDLLLEEARNKID